MRTIASILGESLAATFFMALCLSLPALFGVPSWTLSLFVLPAVVYLTWRLEGHPQPRWEMILWVAGKGFFVFLWSRFPPTDREWWIVLFLIILIPPGSWLWWPKTKKVVGPPVRTSP